MLKLNDGNYGNYLSHVRRPEDGRDDEHIADDAAHDDQRVQGRQQVHGEVGHRLIVNNVLK